MLTSDNCASNMSKPWLKFHHEKTCDVFITSAPHGVINHVNVFFGVYFSILRLKEVHVETWQVSLVEQESTPSAPLFVFSFIVNGFSDACFN